MSIDWQRVDLKYLHKLQTVKYEFAFVWLRYKYSFDIYQLNISNAKVHNWHIDKVTLIAGDKSFKNKYIVNTFWQMMILRVRSFLHFIRCKEYGEFQLQI